MNPQPLAPESAALPLSHRAPLHIAHQVAYMYGNIHAINLNLIKMTTKTIEPRCETRSDTNWAAKPQKMARGLKFRIKEVEGLYYQYSENKDADQLRVTAKLICIFVFAYAKSRFSQDAAQFMLSPLQFMV